MLDLRSHPLGERLVGIEAVIVVLWFGGYLSSGVTAVLSLLMGLIYVAARPSDASDS